MAGSTSGIAATPPDPTPGPAAGAEAARIAAVRRFNRFWTQRIGVLEEGLVGGPFTLTETRVLHDVAHSDRPSASRIGRALGLDAGYLSRILRGFEEKGLIARQPDPADQRRAVLRLTPAGEAALTPLEARSAALVAGLLAPLPEDACDRLVRALGEAEALLGPAPGAGANGAGRGGAEPGADKGPVPGMERGGVALREHRPGDIGWVISRHGALYAREYGLDLSFEALVAGIAADFVRDFDPARERAWIAERDGVRLGSVFLVRGPDPDTAKLRLLLVEPAARGLGLGRRLVAECEAFARGRGYRRIRLWTNSCLLAARGIYAAAGYRLIASEPHRSFGQALVGETWELDLFPG